MQQPQLSLEGINAKRCGGCGVVKPLEEFHRNRRRRDGRQYRCIECNIEINKAWYAANPDVKQRRMYPYGRRRRLENHQRVLDHLRTHPCVDCGEADPVVLEFDHLRDKVRNVSGMLTHPWEKIAAEIEKCEVVCANCHRRRTAARLGSFRFRSVADRGRDSLLEPPGV